MMLTPDTALAEVQTIWSEVAPRLNLDPSAYSASIARAKLKDKNPRVVVRLEGEGLPSLILKQYLDPSFIEHFRNGVQAHQRAMEAFAGQSEMGVPKLQLVDEDRLVCVMDHVAGYTAQDALGLAISQSDRAYILRACGAWLGHWHRATFVRENQITPNVMQKFVTAQRDRVEEGTLKVPDPKRFITCSNKALETAEAARGKVTRLAITHGDMNMQNLILGPDGTFGLDFGAIHNAPIGHDLARFFVNFASYHYPDDSSGREAEWLTRDHNAFFEGYAADAQEDPSFHYLMRTQVLKDWSTIPRSPGKRNALHQRRWRGLKILADLLF